MPLDQPAEPRRADPGLNLFDSALRDGAVVLDAYARFAATLIGTLVFPYAALARAKSASGEEAAETPAQSPPRPPQRGIAQIAIALLVGIVLGRRLFGRGSLGRKRN
jgi:hypothetical protein